MEFRLVWRRPDFRIRIHHCSAGLCGVHGPPFPPIRSSSQGGVTADQLRFQPASHWRPPTPWMTLTSFQAFHDLRGNMVDAFFSHPSIRGSVLPASEQHHTLLQPFPVSFEITSSAGNAVDRVYADHDDAGVVLLGYYYWGKNVYGCPGDRVPTLVYWGGRFICNQQFPNPSQGFFLPPSAFPSDALIQVWVSGLTPRRPIHGLRTAIDGSKRPARLHPPLRFTPCGLYTRRSTCPSNLTNRPP